MTDEQKEKNCCTCEFLRIKDFIYGICQKTGDLVQPCDSCDKWKLKGYKGER